jgi:RNA polymerase sigma-70 factor (ECF subfamily)
MRMSLAGTMTWELTTVRFRPERPAGKPPESKAAPNPAPSSQWQWSGRGQTPERALEKHLEGERHIAEWQVLVQRCLDGDSLAWTELVKGHHRRVYGLCYRFTGSAQDAEDLTQDVFVKIYGNLASFDLTRGTFQTWITTLTRNLLVDHFRRTRQQRVTDSMDAGWEESDEQPLAHRLSDSGPTQHDRAVHKEIEKMVQEALTKISPELREAVILRDLQDMDYKEIAQVLHIPEGTVKSRISRGRAELARLLERNKGQVV